MLLRDDKSPLVVGTAQSPRGAGIVAGQRGRRVANCSCVEAKAFAAALLGRQSPPNSSGNEPALHVAPSEGR